jgi:hypothetical protein
MGVDEKRSVTTRDPLPPSRGRPLDRSDHSSDNPTRCEKCGVAPDQYRDAVRTGSTPACQQAQPNGADFFPVVIVHTSGNTPGKSESVWPLVHVMRTRSAGPGMPDDLAGSVSMTH